MRRAGKILEILMLSAMVFAAVPAPAQAAFSWYWLDNWSGPGSFRGQYFEWRLVCIPEQEERSSAKAADTTAEIMVISSACGKDKNRRASVDLSFTTLHTFKPNEKYAGGKEIDVTVLEPSFTWRLFDRGVQVDAGTGGGVYWFSSEGFQSFSGLILEPVRFDFQFPSKVKGKDLRDTNLWWLRIPMFRLGWMVVPSGYNANAFATSGDGAKRLPAELRLTLGAWFDLDPVLQRLK